VGGGGGDGVVCGVCAWVVTAWAVKSVCLELSSCRHGGGKGAVFLFVSRGRGGLDGAEPKRLVPVLCTVGCPCKLDTWGESEKRE
jgi:hypothetical protein